VDSSDSPNLTSNTLRLKPRSHTRLNLNSLSNLNNSSSLSFNLRPHHKSQNLNSLNNSNRSSSPPLVLSTFLPPDHLPTLQQARLAPVSLNRKLEVSSAKLILEHKLHDLSNQMNQKTHHPYTPSTGSNRPRSPRVSEIVSAFLFFLT
jgi:hypothetical protein